MNASSLSSEALAIIGMSCRLPGADGLEQFWELVRRGKTAWGPLPADRLNRDLYYDPEKGTVGKSYSDLGGLISERPIDLQRCPIPSKWLDSCDIAHLLVCEVAADALRDAGYDPFALPRRDVGVFIGHTGGSQRVCDIVYGTCIEDEVRWLKSVSALGSLGLDGDEIAAEIVRRVRAKYPKGDGETPDLGGLVASSLVSKLFNLHGPHLVVDAACASSFQALSVGARALRQGRIGMALVGGASYCKSDSLVLFSQAQSVSALGSCPFSASADGLITAEGYVIFAVKTLERAVADGDRIHAIIRGIGVASDGKGKSLWAPRKEGQILAVHRAYGRDVEVSRLQYIEAHATSTQVGDATELSALSEALTGRLPPGVKLPIGSVKGNIGHTLETAGAAGMLKAILAMKHGVIPPAVQRGELNTTIEWKDCPFYVPFREEPWPEATDGHPRRVAVNAFGIGGLNVHIVLDEYQPQKATVGAPAARPAADLLTHDDMAVAIVGAGCIFPGAFTLDAFWNLLKSGVDPKIEAPVDRWASDVAYEPGGYRPYRTYNRLGGFIDGYGYDWRRHKVPPKQVAQANPLQFMLLDAADQAFQDSGYHTKTLDRTRVGVVVGTMFGGDFSNQLQLGIRLPEFNETLSSLLRERGVGDDDITRVVDEFRKRLMEKMPALIDETGSFTSSTLASRITKTFNLMGGAMALDAGGCSSLAALQASVDILREKSCDMVVCAAGQRAMDLMSYELLAECGFLSHGSPRGPFDAKADGVVPGEGCGVLLLKRLSDARRDADRIRGVIRGVASRHDATDKEKAVAEVMRAALKEAHLAPEHVSGVEPIGYGIPKVDRMEVSLIEKVYAVGREKPLQVGGLRSQIGDTGAASGMAAVLKASLSLEHKTQPATLNLSDPIPPLHRDGSGIQATLSNTSIPAVNEEGYRAFGISSLHGNLAYHLILDNGAPRPAAPSGRDAAWPAVEKNTPRVEVASPVASTAPGFRTYRVSSADWPSLVAKLSEIAAQPESAFSNPVTRFESGNPVRCAIVADSAASLAKRAHVAVEAIRHGTSPDALMDQGIVCVETSGPQDRIAVLLPGQGSQYPGMLRDLCQQHPAASRTMRRFDNVLEELGLETFERLAWQDGDSLGKDIWRTQASMLVADAIAWEVLADAGLHPDYIAAHSFGEFPALYAAGAWTFREAAMATRARCAAVSASQAARGTMLSVFAPLTSIQRLLTSSKDQVWVCAENGPEQVVVGGRTEHVERFAESLRQAGIKFKALAVPCPFHTPLLSDAQPHLRQALADRAITPPRIPVLSSTNARFVVEPDEIRSSLVKQFTEPVHFRAVVERLYDYGVRIFVESGPNQVLTQLAKRILSDRAGVSFASLDHPSRSGVEQLARLLAFLEAKGIVKSTAAEIRAGGVIEVSRPALHFDATETRRRRKRTQASKGSGSDRSAGGADRPQATTLPRRGETASAGDWTERESGVPTGSAVTHPPISTAGNSPAPVAPGLAAAAHRSSATSGVSRSRDGSHLGNGSGGNGAANDAPERKSAALASTRVHVQSPSILDALRDYLVRFVVDQTGYPAEIVDIHADLEADLGIDSIKKAQLFGELGEEFSLQADENLSLDDFPTLQHVLDYLVAQPSVLANRRFAAVPADDAATVPVMTVAISADPVESVSGTTVSRGQDASRPASPAARASGLEPAIEEMLIQFVVEQTGYPADIVDLDADLEADLGIDSIKKAQLFGEIGERFDLQPDENLSLDDFPTLRHVRTYLLSQPSVQSDRELRAPPGAAVTAGDRASKPGAGTLQTGTLPVAPLPAVSSNTVPLHAGPAPSQRQAASSEDDWDLEAILVNFVVEQTGYPSEIVDLDADLEADLGIDSIKKAQLFGEIGEQFRIDAEENLSLDDFPTLRHVLAYLKSALASRKETVSVSNWQQADSAEIITGAEPVPLPPSASANRSSPRVSSIKELSTQEPKSSFDHGFQHGRGQKAEIGRAIQWMASLGGEDLNRGNPSLEFLSSDEAAELRGIAEGSEVALETILAWSFFAGELLSPASALWQGSQGDSVGLLAAWWGAIEPSVRTGQRPNGRTALIVHVPGAIGALAGVNDSGICAVLTPVENGHAGRPPTRVPASLVCQRILDEALDLEQAEELARHEDATCGTITLAQRGGDDVVSVTWLPGRPPEVRKLTPGAGPKPRAFVRGKPSQLVRVEAPSSPAELLSHIDALSNGEAKDARGIRASRSAAAVIAAATEARAFAGIERSGRSIPSTGWRSLETKIAFSAGNLATKKPPVSDTRTADSRTADTRTASAADRSRPSIRYDYEKNSVTHRYVLRLKPLAPAAAATAADLCGPVWIIGSGSKSQAIADRMSEAGVKASVFSLTGSLDDDIRRFEAAISSKMPRHVVLATEWEPADPPPSVDDWLRSVDDWLRVRDRRLLVPFWILHRWLTALAGQGALENVRLSAVTAMGGDFGLSGPMASYTGGGLAGLLKGIRNEHPEITVKIVDVADIATVTASRIVDELASRDGETEVGLRGGGRWAIRPALQRASELPAGDVPRPGDAWVVTGGARGVTAVVAREVARTFGVNLHILGTTAAGKIDRDWLRLDAEGIKQLRSQVMVQSRREGADALTAWRQIEKGIELERNLNEFAAAGVKASYHVCDVSDWDSLRRTLATIRRDAGAIRGVLHGAGYEAAAKFERKKPDPVRTTVSVKSGGAEALIALTQDDPLGFFIGFGSTSGRYGGIGQADYSLANELLAKQLGHLRVMRPGCRATTFHWHAWGEVGMAARPESKFALEGFGLSFMPTREGVGHVLAELAAGLPEPEILITEPKLCPECVPSDTKWPDAREVVEPIARVAKASSPQQSLLSKPDNVTEKNMTTTSASPVNLEEFLINFVVEQTGYPPEIVELDADLEGDLGIDSIKKAQLFGEIGETFQIKPDENLSLDDFPTLRHVLEYLQQQPHLQGRVTGTSLEQAAPAGQRAQSSAPTAASAGIPPSPAAPPAARTERYPLIDDVTTDAHGRHVVHVLLNPEKDLFLQEHKYMGRALLPAVVAAELLVEGVLAAVPGQPWTSLNKMEIHNGLHFKDKNPIACRIVVEPIQGGAKASLVSDVGDGSRNGDDSERLHVSGYVLLGGTASVPAVDYVEPPFGYYGFQYIDNAAIYHGQSLRTLRGILLQHECGYGELRMPAIGELAGQRGGAGWQLPSALIDGCLVACAVFQYLMFGRRVDIPQAFDRIQVVRMPKAGEYCYLRYQYRGRDERYSWYDFHLFDEERRLAIVVEGFRCVCISGESGR